MPKAKFQKAVVRDTRKSEKALMTSDGYMNLFAQLGSNTQNLSAGARYDFGSFLTRQRLALDAAYRSSWIVGQVVDTKAEDMVRAGINIESEDLEPSEISKLQRRMTQLNVWKGLTNAIKWGRLYGGAAAIILIEGQKMDTPLKIDTIGKGAFKGLLVLDRWLLTPSLGNLVQEYGPDFALPKYYNIVPTSTALKNEKIHHTRVLRFGAIELPYIWKQAENMWDESVVERLYDRLLAFDSTTQGAAQLVFKAHLRTVKVEGLREILATGGVLEQALIRQFQYIRQMQSNEGLTLLDSKDDFDAHQYTFAGLSDVLLQFGQQLSGATGIPLVRLFGQSPTGMNSTGESDLRMYYDNVNKDQENHLKEPLFTVLSCLSMSELSKPLSEDATISFNPLWQMDDKEKVDLAKGVGDTVASLFNSGLLTKAMSLKELKQVSRITGQFTNITDDDVQDAEDEADLMPTPGEVESDDEGNPIAPPSGGALLPAKKNGDGGTSLVALEKKIDDLIKKDDNVHASIGDGPPVYLQAVMDSLDRRLDQIALMSSKPAAAQQIILKQEPIEVKITLDMLEQRVKDKLALLDQKQIPDEFELMDAKGNVHRRIKVKRGGTK